MVIYCKRNILFRSDDGSEVYPVRREYIGEVPDWVTKTKYFARLVADGAISVPEHKTETARKPKNTKADKAE